MSKRGIAPIFPIILDQNAPLYQQLYDAFRKAILARRIPGGSPLPSTRRLASELNISRTTVINAYEQLLAEGYIEGKGGAGTYVADVLPDEQLQTDFDPVLTSKTLQKERRLSKQGSFFEVLAPKSGVAFKPLRTFPMGIPALDVFPFAEWRQLGSQCYRTAPRELFAYSSPAGYEPLREALAKYLVLARAVKCDPSQILIVTGTQQAIDLAARLLLDPGDQVWMEDPGYVAARRALEGVGAAVVPIPVDDDGIDITAGMTISPDARLAYVTPSHQFPLGVTMKLSRRLRLLDWAYQSGAWILEDDYNSELRFTGHPLPSWVRAKVVRQRVAGKRERNYPY